MRYFISDSNTGEIVRRVEGSFISARVEFEDVLMDAAVRFELDRKFELFCCDTGNVVRQAAVCLEEIDKDFLVEQIGAVSRYIGLARYWDRSLPGKVEDLQHMLSVLKRIEDMEADIAPVSGPTAVEFADDELAI